MSIDVIGAIGAVVIPLGGLMLKMWVDHSRLAREMMERHTDISKRVIDVVEKNSESFQRLNASVDENTKVTRETRKVLEAQNDQFSKLLLVISKKPKKRK